MAQTQSLTHASKALCHWTTFWVQHITFVEAEDGKSSSLGFSDYNFCTKDFKNPFTVNYSDTQWPGCEPGLGCKFSDPPPRNTGSGSGMFFKNFLVVILMLFIFSLYNYIFIIKIIIVSQGWGNSIYIYHTLLIFTFSPYFISTNQDFILRYNWALSSWSLQIEKTCKIPTLRRIITCIPECCTLIKKFRCWEQQLIVRMNPALRQYVDSHKGWSSSLGKYAIVFSFQQILKLDQSYPKQNNLCLKQFHRIFKM